MGRFTEIIATYYPNGLSTSFEGIPLGGSSYASGTDFSGVSISDGNRVLRNVTVYGGLANDDVVNIIVSGVYLTSGVHTLASGSHSFDYEIPQQWNSGASVIVELKNNTVKDANVNAVLKYFKQQ